MQWWCSAQGTAWSWGWQAYPGIWLFVLALAGGYAWMLRRTETAAEARRTHRIPLFVAGILALWAGLDWPIGALGAGYLASAHMVQFILITLVAAPLLLAGVPETLYRRLDARPIVNRILRATTNPLVALAIFNLIVITTHVPGVSDRLMVSQLGSFAIDTAWLLAGFVFWWPIATPVPETRWNRPLVHVGYLGLQMIASTPLFFFLTFADFPLYSIYELAPRVNGLGAREDQQIAGLLMKIVGGTILLVAATVQFMRWTREQEAADAVPRPALAEGAGG